MRKLTSNYGLKTQTFTNIPNYAKGADGDMTMHQKDNQQIPLNELLRLAEEKLSESRDDEEEWDFLFKTKDAIEFAYVDKDDLQDWEFDPDECGWEDIDVDEKRLLELKKNPSLTPDELMNWRIKRANYVTEQCGSECKQGFVVPIWVDEKIEGFALVTTGYYDENPDEMPSLVGVFYTAKEALASIPDCGYLGSHF